MAKKVPISKRKPFSPLKNSPKTRLKKVKDPNRPGLAPIYTRDHLFSGIIPVIDGTLGGNPLQLDLQLLFDTAKCGASIEQISVIMKCSRDVLYDRYIDIINAGREAGVYEIHKHMQDKSLGGIEKGDTQLLIWLSKNRCGYKEKIEKEETQIVYNVVIKEVQ